MRSTMSRRIVSRKFVVASYTVDHCTDFTLPEPIKAEGGDVGSPKPRRLKFSPVCDD